MEFNAIQILIIGGTAAVLIPVLIHLFNRTRFQVTDWAAMEFLIAALKKTRRRVRLENLLLLLLRILVLVFVALMLARPSIEGQVPVPKKAHYVIVIDNSWSMEAQVGEQSAFDRARDLIRGMIARDALAAGNGLTLIPTSATAGDFQLTLLDSGEDGDNATTESQPIGAAEESLREQIRTVASDIETARNQGDDDEVQRLSSRLDGLQRQLIQLRRESGESTGRRSDNAGTVTGPSDAGSNDSELFTTDTEWVGDRLDEMTVSLDSNVNWLETFRIVRRALEEGAERFEARQVIVFTDMQYRNFPEVDDPRLPLWRETFSAIDERTDGPIRFVNVGDMATNRTIVKAELVETVVGVGVPLKLRVTLRNNSLPRGEGAGSTAQNRFSLSYSRNDGIAKRLPDVTGIAPGEQRAVQFELEPFDQPGDNWIQVRLTEEDALDTDNAAWAVVQVRPEVRVLAIDGSPGTNRTESETVYFELAVGQVSARVHGSGDSRNRKTPLLVQTAVPDDLTSLDLNDYDVVVLANVQNLPPASVGKLESWVSAGGPLVFTLGDTIDRRFYNSDLYRGGEGLFPVELGEHVEQPAGAKMVAVRSPEYHPSVRPIAEQDDTTDSNYLQGPNFYHWFSVVARPSDGIRPIIDIESDNLAHPLMFTSNFGNGEVVVFTSSLDGMWFNDTANSLTRFTVNIAIWQLMMYELANQATSNRQLRLGQPYERQIKPEEYSESIYIHPPGTTLSDVDAGILVPLVGREQGSREGAFTHRIEFTDTFKPGKYTVSIFKLRDTIERLVLDLLKRDRAVPPAARAGLASEIVNRLANDEDASDLSQALTDADVSPAAAERLAGHIASQAAAVMGASGGPAVIRDFFIVNPGTEEGDLLRIGTDAPAMTSMLAQLLPDVEVAIENRAAADAETGGASDVLVPRKSLIWKYVAMALLVFLALEMLVAMAFTSRQR